MDVEEPELGVGRVAEAVRDPCRRRDKASRPGSEDLVADEELGLAGEDVERVDVILVDVRVDALEVRAEAQLDDLELRQLAEDAVVALGPLDPFPAFGAERRDPVGGHASSLAVGQHARIVALRLRGGICSLGVLAVALASCAAGGARTATGSFASNDPLLNLIWADSVRTAADMLAPGPLTTDALDRPCAIDLPTVILDGTVRDRCPYVGDEAVIGPTLDVSRPHWAVQRAMLVWFAAHQHPDGAIPASPLVHGQIVLIDYNAYWVLALYNYVLYSGDVGLARQVWPHLVKLLDGWYPAHTHDGLLVNDENLGDYGFQLPGQLVAYYNAQYSLALEHAAQLARWLGDAQDEARWLARRRPIARAFTRVFWDAKAGAFVDTTKDRATHPEDAQAFAILAGLATPKQATAALAYLGVHEWRGYGQTVTDTGSWDGPAVGGDVQDRVYPFISYFEVLARYAAGQPEIALQLIRREWGYMAKNGPSTNRGTMWETIGPYGGGPVNVHQSWDAGWSSGAAPALTNYVLGVQPTSPGYATFKVTPRQGDLAWARGSVVTPHGLLTVSWQRTAGSVRLHVTAPAGTRWIRS